MKKQLPNKQIRSYRIDPQILEEAKKKNLNVNHFIEECLRLYLTNQVECPSCKKRIKE